MAGLVVGCAGGPGEARLWVPGRIDGRPAKLVLDTGASDFFLWEDTARQMGLEVTPPPRKTQLPSSRIVAGETSECRLEVAGFTPARVKFRTVDVPRDLRRGTRVDGVIGWWNVRSNILHLDAARGRATVLSRLPVMGDEWLALRIRPEFRVLVVEVPTADGRGFLFVDTGAEGGIALPEKSWTAWKADNPDAPAARESYFSPHVGRVTERECRWAERLDFGALIFREVVLTPQHPALEKDVSVWGADYLGTIGMGALAGFECVIDGPRHVLHLRPAARGPRRLPARGAGVLSDRESHPN